MGVQIPPPAPSYADVYAFLTKQATDGRPVAFFRKVTGDPLVSEAYFFEVSHFRSVGDLRPSHCKALFFLECAIYSMIE